MNYLNKIENLIENHIIETKRYNYHLDQNKLNTYFNIGKLLVEAQGGSKRAKYGNGLIKEYSIILSKKYGKGYDPSNLKRMRNFYIVSKKGATLWHQLTWSHCKILLTINNENKRNYYINLSIQNRLDVRSLRNEIRNKSFERLSYADKNNIKLIEKNDDINIIDMIKGPIIISINNNINEKLNEKALKKCILDNIEKFLLELGCGFAFIGSEQRIKVNNNYRFIDLVFFNVKLNCYVLIELKIKNLNIKDIGQLEFYVNYYDTIIKETFHNATIGIVVCKKNDQVIENVFNKNNIKITSYELETTK